MDRFFATLAAVNDILWHDTVLLVVLASGVLFTCWSVGSQFHSLTHGVAVTRGRYDKGSDPGAIHHFQALSAALSATVGIGNIGGVALAISLGGPGAVFWMWVIGAIGMALKTTEVSLSMLYRDVSDPERPRGGPMLVARRGFAEIGWPRLGRAVAAVFVVTLLISSFTGGNMFQAWNVAEVSEDYFGVPRLAAGLVLMLVVGAVILGGIRRIGAVAGALVPAMCGLYLLAALAVVVANISVVPEVMRDIFTSAFSARDAQGAFLGGGAGQAMLWGLKRALFSSEAGQGSSPIAHCAAKTDEPIREGIVAGLEPFIDTLVVCTLTALVILSSGIWNRSVDLQFVGSPQVVQTAGGWTLASAIVQAAPDCPIDPGDRVFAVAHVAAADGLTIRQALAGELHRDETAQWTVRWGESSAKLQGLAEPGVFLSYRGAAFTGRAFDRSIEGLGKWLVSLAVWLFAISTMISWSYYGEQGVLHLFGSRAVIGYKILYCSIIPLATLPGWLTSDAELDHLTMLGTGVMLWVNVPILLVFGVRTMAAYRDYRRRWRGDQI